MRININKRKLRIFIKKAIFSISLLIMLLLIIIGMKQSDFSNIKKYNKDDKAFKEVDYNPKKLTIKYYNTKITINEENSLANLGDFVFNVAGDKKLIANISLKFKSYKKDQSWIIGDDSIKNEILFKNAVLRDAIIDTMIGSSNATINNKRMREEIKNSINKKLSKGQIEDVYFNEFILQ